MKERRLLLSASAAFLLVGCTDADAGRELGDNETMTAAEPAAPAPSPTAAALSGAQDGSLMTLAGTVVAAAPDWFRLKSGDEEVTVEMDDWDWYQEGKALKVGDVVTVTGRVDKGLWQQRKIEASSVYVRNLGVSFLANGADEEERTAALIQVGTATTSAQGVVSAVEGQEFTVGSMTGPVRVDMSDLETKPKVATGDRVYSWGNFDVDAAEGVEMKAQGVVLLSSDKTKRDTSTRSQQNSDAATTG